MSNNVNECRICFETETDIDPFVFPCACKGTSRYIHVSCLEKWRSSAENREARQKCMECGERYIISRSYPLEIYPFTNSIMVTDNMSKGFRNNMFISMFGCIILYWMDANNQTSLTVFSFGQNWYNNTIGRALTNGNEEITIPYYVALNSFLQHFFLLIYFYYKIYRKIRRKREFFNFIKYELFFLNLLVFNFLYIFWAGHEYGQQYYTFFIIMVFLMMGGVCNYMIAPALLIITKNSIKYLNYKKNPETVLNTNYNPLNTVIEMQEPEQKYQELSAESDESVASAEA